MSRCDCGEEADPVLAATGKPLCRRCYMALPPAPSRAATAPLYATTAGYLAALETHGATIGDIPRMMALLRQLEAMRAGLMTYIEDAVQACGDERVSGEPLAQALRRIVGELRELRSDAHPPTPVPTVVDYQPALRRWEVRLSESTLASWRGIAHRQGAGLADTVRVAMELLGERPCGTVRARLDAVARRAESSD